MSAQEAYYYALTANEIGYFGATDVLDNAIKHVRDKADKTDEDYYYLGQLYMLDDDDVAAKEEFERSKGFVFSKIMYDYLSNSETSSDYSSMIDELKLSGIIDIDEYALSQFQDYFHFQECIHYPDLELPTDDFEKLFWKAFTLDAANINAVYKSFGKNQAASIKQKLISQMEDIKSRYNTDESNRFVGTVNKNSSDLRAWLKDFIDNVNMYNNTHEEELALTICENKKEEQQLILNIVYSFIDGKINSEQYIDLMYYFRYKQLEKFNKALINLFDKVNLIPSINNVFDLITVAVSCYELVGQNNNSDNIQLPTDAQNNYRLFIANEWKQILVDYNVKNYKDTDPVILTDFIPVYTGKQVM